MMLFDVELGIVHYVERRNKFKSDRWDGGPSGLPGRSGPVGPSLLLPFLLFQVHPDEFPVPDVTRYKEPYQQ